MKTLDILIVIGGPIIFMLPFVIGHLLWRRKYVDKKTGWNKCGVCGAITDPIYFEHGIFFTKYHCQEHSPGLNSNKKKK